jgi:hypothetical protein
MPKTAYLKLIDIWLIFCLVVPFLTFIIQIYWELERAKREKSPTTATGWVPNHPPKNEKSMMFIQYSVVSLTLVLVIAYWAYALTVYFNVNV